MDGDPLGVVFSRFETEAVCLTYQGEHSHCCFWTQEQIHGSGAGASEV